MTNRPMLFSAPMVRALLAGTKTQTRRLLKPQPSAYIGNPTPPEGRSWIAKPRNKPYFAKHDDQVHWCWWDEWNRQGPDWIKVRVANGDRVYVRETWAPLDRLTHNDPGVQALSDRGFYQADQGTVEGEISRWTPSIHQPRWASRLTLTVTDVRVERLQDISESDALAEGVSEFFRGPERLGLLAAAQVDVIAVASGFLGGGGAVAMYRDLWNSINGKSAWEANPWVVATSFTVLRGNLDRLAA